MSMRPRKSFRVSVAFLLLLLVLCLSWFPESVSPADVTLTSIEIFKIHEWLPTEPAIYFRCKDENRTVLPDVKKIKVLLTFKGEESWQPLTQFFNKKCKRCGLYEQGNLKADDIYDEWELCPCDFMSKNGTYKNATYTHFKKMEFNATFRCSDCESLLTGSNHLQKKEKKEIHWAIIALITVTAIIVCVVSIVAGYKCWQKRKREHDKLRFLKLFEEGDDDIEDELGIGPLTNTI